MKYSRYTEAKFEKEEEEDFAFRSVFTTYVSGCSSSLHLSYLSFRRYGGDTVYKLTLN